MSFKGYNSNTIIYDKHKDKMLLSDALSPGSYMTLAVTLVTSQSGHLLPLVPRERDTLSHTHTQQTESSLSFLNMCVSALFIILSLSYSHSHSGT